MGRSTANALTLVKLKPLSKPLSARASSSTLSPRHRVTSRLNSLPPPSTIQDQTIDGDRFWAVLVGIDTYDDDKSLQLQGACTDTLEMYNYLITNLHVSPRNIQLLVTEQKCFESAPFLQTNIHYPTRDNILNALYDLRDNPRILRGDNILFYFAGRGSRYHALPLGIEALCPADRGRAVEGSNSPIYDISDRELSISLQEICAAKGDHITAIIDCCYTAGGEDVGNLRSVRYAPSLPHTSSEALLSISHPRKCSNESYLSPTWDWNGSSCVLLSAALPSGWAKEAPFDNQYRGYFTRALLALLKHKSYSSYRVLCQEAQDYMPKSITYRPLQIPTAIGDKKDCKPWFLCGHEKL